jgi:hypothetical protein
MRIQQIDPNSRCFSAECRGKWYCSDSKPGHDGDPINRYLQHDGSWGKITQYFDNEQDINTALSKGEQPDFSLSLQELQDRADIRQMTENCMRDWEGLE